MSDQPDDSERVLVLARGHDAAPARSLLTRNGFAVESCANANELLMRIGEGAGCAIIAQEELSRAVHARFADMLAAQPAWSDFPLVVLATAASLPEQPGAVIAALGNVTLVEGPVTGHALLTALRSALRGRRRQYEARAAIRQRDQFLAMLGHELRNPLGAIVLATEVVTGVPPDAALLARRIETVARQAQHLTRLVDDLLDVARVTTGRVKLRRERIDLHDVIDGCVAALSAFACERGIRVEGRRGARVMIDGDGVRLEQVFNNLLANAIKYSPAGSTVTITTVLDGDGLCEVRVRDQGIGIESAMAGRIFELFAQVDGALARSHGGMGIGLTLVKRLVELHDGSVTVRSDGLGTGSEFIVRLPTAGGRPRLATPPGIAVGGTSASPVRVVLVDDNDDIRELSRAVLERLGCVVEDAADGPQGLATILRETPDLALVDIGLPGMDGFAVANAVRAQLGDSPLLVAVTGYGQPQDQDRARAAGFDVHLTKPVHTVALRAMVDRARVHRG